MIQSKVLSCMIVWGGLLCVSQEDASEMLYSRATGRSPLRGRDIQLGLGVWVCLLSRRVGDGRSESVGQGGG